MAREAWADQGVDGAGAEWLVGGGEMGRLIGSMDWSTTPLGPVTAWSSSLRMMVRFMLANRFPLLLWWGPSYVSIYNDAYCPVLGTKHPWALGRPVSECWSEIWDVLKPLVDTPFHGGPATWDEDILLEIDRYGFVEETHFTIAYSPVPDDSTPEGIGGVLATVHETTNQVVGERRVVALRDLGSHLFEARTAPEACEIAAQALAPHARDLPFMLLYLVDDDGGYARLAGSVGVKVGEDISPLAVDLRVQPRNGWPLAMALEQQSSQTVTRLNERFTEIPSGPWGSPPDTAVVMPISPHIGHAPIGLLVAGVSPRLEFDDYYRAFLDLVRARVTAAIANARAYEEERRRAEALAELDRAKTMFFSNVSHEFRTPLTLMLGPLEDVLAGEDSLSPQGWVRLDMAHRNARRLLKLVNTLLDFSRIEAGRERATYERTDLARLTTDLASQFRSAIEQAGLRLRVDCPPLPEATVMYVDREMWEKIVLNLLSNAFKFTFDGEIAVSLRPANDGGSVQLIVKDTGTGIPAEEIPHLFERFHRVQGAESRTHEGTGIGLALVQELVKLHGGVIAVESEVGWGTTFTVRIPSGRRHLPVDRVRTERALASAAAGAAPFVEEALSWLPGEVRPPQSLPGDPPDELGLLTRSATQPDDRNDTPGALARVLLADDNADMRAYLLRLLSPRYQVEAVPNGSVALAAAIERPPDLVLADVMMPGLDGFGLLRALRDEPRTREVPVVLLSARAGEEAKVEGLQAGADDYLIKPFSARELLARVDTHIELARARAEAADRERAVRLEAEEARRQVDLARQAHDEFLTETAHDLKSPLAVVKGRAELLRRQAQRAGLDDGDGRLIDGLKSIENSASQIEAQIDALIDIARLRTGQPLELNRQPMDLVALARRTASQQQQTTDRHQVEVETLEPALDGVWDTTRLERLLVNLVRNAIKYSPDGGLVTISIEREHGSKHDWAVLRVSDQGVGIPVGDLPEIFLRFQRASNIGQIAGTGIGLASVRQIAEQHGGSVSVESEVGRGSVFTVRLPLA